MAEPIPIEEPGAALLARLLTRPRVRVAHRLGAGLIVEAELARDRRPLPVPFVLGYTPTARGGMALAHAYAGASSVSVEPGGGYLFLSDLRSAGQAGRTLRRHRLGPDGSAGEPELVFGAPRDVVSYAVGGPTALAAVWVSPDARSLAEDAALRAARAADLCTARVVRGDLWPRSAYHADGDVLGVVHVPLVPGAAPELVPLPLERDVLFTGELALTPDGRTGAAGVVRFLPGGHRRYGQLLFRVADPGVATALWSQDDIVDLVAGPDGAWFAGTAERVARPGLGPCREAVLVAADGSRVVRLAPGHPDWLEPRAWADPETVLCIGAQDGRRHLWRVAPGRVARIDLPGSVQAVTSAADGEALVVVSGIDTPPEVRSVPATGPAGPVIAPAAAAAPAGRMERLIHHAPDGSAWRSWLCLPAGESDHRLPVLVWCHGGPLLSWTDWSWRWNPWPFVAEGYAVLMPDPPLSVGYGQQAIERGWGRWTSEVAAVAAGQVRAALEHPALDPGRVAAMGGSFGGYLALALATLMPEIRLVASHCGWADFAAVARACDLHWHWLREYGPVDTEPGYRRESLRLDAVRPGVRVLLSHGCEDTHVPVGEARAMYRTLQTRGIDVELMLLAGERHSIQRPANVTAWFRWVLRACRTSLPAPSTRKEPSLR
ncbi:MAG TPA: prolyl oligopeptidase family serine peptidase [Actinophytocola sp.]|uniref:alpha/beta hydrolase family protein n=1 Tax=Actinophytocola sp. TaxID=1872138 RepID=UPI002DC05D55|nr:prolyl oligopeptidase family serine peptidase [Actinophytocola sp.]HEU5469195.1 prolyl oligopeptidase family serine peptidase [Actinophytocola sp.]